MKKVAYWLGKQTANVLFFFENLFTTTGKIERGAVIRSSIYFVVALIFAMVTFGNVLMYIGFIVALQFVILIHVLMIWLKLKTCVAIQGPQGEPGLPGPAGPIGAPAMMTRGGLDRGATDAEFP